MKSEASASAAKGRLIKAVGSEYGQVVADGKGEAFYVFDKESSAKSECYGACAAGVAAGPHQRQAPRRQRRRDEIARHHTASERQAAGDLWRPAALLLRRGQPRQHPLPKRE